MTVGRCLFVVAVPLIVSGVGVAQAQTRDVTFEAVSRYCLTEEFDPILCDDQLATLEQMFKAAPDDVEIVVHLANGYVALAASAGNSPEGADYRNRATERLNTLESMAPANVERPILMSKLATTVEAKDQMVANR